MIDLSKKTFINQCQREMKLISVLFDELVMDVEWVWALTNIFPLLEHVDEDDCDSIATYLTKALSDSHIDNNSKSINSQILFSIRKIKIV